MPQDLLLDLKDGPRSPSASSQYEVAAFSVEGVSKSAISRVMEIAWTTVHCWLEKVAACCRRFNDRMIKEIEVKELQADELHTFVGFRQSSAYLTRRSACHARCEKQLEGQIEIVRCYYNFVRPHRALKFGSETRTPAMQAGLTNRRLSFREVFTSPITLSSGSATRVLARRYVIHYAAFGCCQIERSVAA